MNSENSALTALSELRNLEANRVADQEADRRARDEAERRAREDAERRAREEAERIARAQAEEYARLQAEHEAREREERIRLQEAETRARAEQEGRLREEQMRLDAQMKLAEKKAKPKWPLVVVPLLVAGVGFAGYMAWDNRRDADEKAEQARVQKEEHDAQLALITEKLNSLEAEQDRLETDKAALDAKLAAAVTEQEKQKIRDEKAELERKIAENEAKQADAEAAGGEGVKRDKPKKKPSGSKPASSASDTPPVTGRKDKIERGDPNDPLSGL
ncbi:MAG: hypothetical protein IAG13_09370 [Deltaproteobacteria bacterium]|nr:hypothetical protein [Nannocystaceae bacterium]